MESIHTREIVTLEDIFRNMRKMWKTVICISSTTFLIATMIALTKDNIYESQAILIPNENAESKAILSGSLAGIASLAGIDVNSFDIDTMHYISMLNSKDFLIPFINENDVKKHIFKKKLDPTTNEWAAPSILSELIFKIERSLAPEEITDMPFSSEPSDEETVKKFKDDFFQISTDAESKLIVIKIKAYTPTTSYSLLNSLIESINSYAKAQKLSEAEKTITFLTNEINTNPSVEVKQASSQLLESQQKTIMLANTREDFAFKTIESPRISYDKAAPNRVEISLLGLLFGVILSFMFVTTKSLAKFQE